MPKVPAIPTGVRAYVRYCLANSSAPRVSELAAFLGMSVYQLRVRVGEQFGTAPSQYLKNEQINCAKKLLRTTKLSSAVIAERAAYGSEKAFNRSFKHETGVTPGEYRRNPE